MKKTNNYLFGTVMEINEEFISGFCKAQNQTRTVMCEFEQQEDGRKVLTDTDCAYGKCEHTKSCLLMGNMNTN